MSYIIAEHLSKQYGSGDAIVSAVDDISFQIEEGEFVGVMGESGAGKSTLLGMMGARNKGQIFVESFWDLFSRVFISCPT